MFPWNWTSSILSQEHHPVSTVSYDGLKLYGEYYDGGYPSTAIIFHGLGAEMYTNCSGQADFFRRNGFNVLLICHRSHGQSEGHWTTIGLREKKDVFSWIQWSQKQGATQILLYGLSMGASAIAYASDTLDPDIVRGIVLDSCYYSVHEQMRSDAIKRHIPKILLLTERLMAGIFFHVDIKTPTTAALSHAKCPVLVVQGTNDLTVDPHWGQVIYDACASPKEFLLMENGHHTLSFLEDRQRAEQVLLSFVRHYFPDFSKE